MCVRLAKLCGAASVGLVGYDASTARGQARFEAGKKRGADFVVDSANENAIEAVRSHLPQGADRVIVTSPPKSMETAIETGRFGETVCFIGIHLGGESKITVDVNELIFNKRALVPSFAEPAIKFSVSLKILKCRMMDADTIITHTFSLEEHEEIFRGIAEGNEAIIKVVCTPHA